MTIPSVTDSEILEMIDKLRPVGGDPHVYCGDRPLNVWREFSKTTVNVREPTTRGRHESGYVELNKVDFCDKFRGFLRDGAPLPDELIRFLCCLHDDPESYGGTIVHNKADY